MRKCVFPIAIVAIAAFFSLTACSSATTPSLSVPQWLQGAWRATLPRAYARQGGVKWFRLLAGAGDIRVQEYRAAFPVTERLSDVTRVERQKSSNSWTVEISVPIFFQGSTRSWRWVYRDPETVDFWPGDGDSAISLKRESAVQKFTAGGIYAVLFVVVGVLGSSSSQDAPAPPEWIQGIWGGSSYEIDGSEVSADGSLRIEFDKNDATISKVGGAIQAESLLSDLYWSEVISDSTTYSVRLTLPLSFEAQVETWRWERLGPTALRFWPSYGASQFSIPLATLK